MWVSYYLPGNRVAPPPGPRAGGIPANEEEEQAIWPFPSWVGTRRRSKLFWSPSLTGGDWDEKINLRLMDRICPKTAKVAFFGAISAGIRPKIQLSGARRRSKQFFLLLTLVGTMGRRQKENSIFLIKSRRWESIRWEGRRWEVNIIFSRLQFPTNRLFQLVHFYSERCKDIRIQGELNILTIYKAGCMPA